jgi:sec-independent protein translocase protein TatA
MEIMLVLIVALLILGPKKLPAAGRSLGEGIRGFKETIRGEKAELAEATATDPGQAPKET